jgi:hypothetical protein
MSQIGAIVISDNINIAKFIELAKTDPKYIIGKEEVLADGTRYIPINKN